MFPPASGVNGTGSINDLKDPNDMEKAIEKVENCFKSCDGLAFDKKLACKAMCICEKRDSSDIDLFDPYKSPGL
ncbi:MAG: hypothetical protein LBD11_01105 [Candidatus Peribacteria bacterium]|jgi:hypothetical protein|nr:hypothetical protein [Candidatus Peribacteria bacterium]